MGKIKSYYCTGILSIRDINIKLVAKIRAVSNAQAKYYCCLQIQEDMEISDFITFKNWNSQGMNSTMNYLRYSLGEEIQYSLQLVEGEYRRIECKELRELVKKQYDFQEPVPLSEAETYNLDNDKE